MIEPLCWCDEGGGAEDGVCANDWKTMAVGAACEGAAGEDDEDEGCAWPFVGRGLSEYCWDACVGEVSGFLSLVDLWPKNFFMVERG